MFFGQGSLRAVSGPLPETCLLAALRARSAWPPGIFPTLSRRAQGTKAFFSRSTRGSIYPHARSPSLSLLPSPVQVEAFMGTSGSRPSTSTSQGSDRKSPYSRGGAATLPASVRRPGMGIGRWPVRVLAPAPPATPDGLSRDGRDTLPNARHGNPTRPSEPIRHSWCSGSTARDSLPQRPCRASIPKFGFIPLAHLIGVSALPTVGCDTRHRGGRRSAEPRESQAMAKGMEEE